MSKTDPSPAEEQYLPVSAEAVTNDLAKVTIVHPFEEERRAAFGIDVPLLELAVCPQNKRKCRPQCV